MTGAMLFSIYLQRHLFRTSKTAAEIALHLDYKTLVPVDTWLRGEALPPSFVLPGIASFFGADPVEVSIGWLIAECPDLEDVLQDRAWRFWGATSPGSRERQSWGRSLGA